MGLFQTRSYRPEAKLYQAILNGLINLHADITYSSYTAITQEIVMNLINTLTSPYKQQTFLAINPFNNVQFFKISVAGL